MEEIKLPSDYIVIRCFDFLHNKKLTQKITYVGNAISIIMIVFMLYTKPLSTLYSNEGFGSIVLKPIVLLVAMFLYTCIHTVIHTILFQIVSNSKPKAGIEDNVMFVAIEGYMLKIDYAVACIAPCLLASVLYIVLMITLPEGWFWVMYLLLVGIISTSMMDIFSVFAALFAPKGALIKDAGSKLTIYAQNKNTAK